MSGVIQGRARWGRTNRVASLVASLALALVAWPATAGAATQLGQLGPATFDCDGLQNMVQAATVTGPAYAVPAPGGVITSFSLVEDGDAGMGRLQVWRPTGGTNYSLVGRSELITTTAGTMSTFLTRIRAAPGDVLGLRTHTMAGFPCLFNAAPGDHVAVNAAVVADPEVGEPHNISDGDLDSRRLNVVASLEPDADGDGFGDETQDTCPTDASTQGTCLTPPLEPPNCAGQPATIVGTDGAETLTGTNGPDVIAALGGGDTVRSMGGDDVVCTGIGNDEADGGSGNDALNGEAGKDELAGKSGNDKMNGGDGNDELNGGSGNDRLKAGKGNDDCIGAGGKDKAPGCEDTKGVP